MSHLKKIEELKNTLKGKKGICAMSGGVDSAVAAALVHAACPDLVSVYVNTGLMRKNESAEIEKVFKKERGMNLIMVDAEERFLSRLKGVDDPNKKRMIIGEEFIRVFEEEAKKIGAVDYLVQGTILADIIESGTDKHKAIKPHHNVGGLPAVVDFKQLVEPLKDLYKPQVRELGLALGLPESIVMRQPFPGPGLGVRVIGEITKAKLDILREADFIFRDEVAAAGLDKEIWQYFAVLLSSRSVGIEDGGRSYGYTVALRAVTSTDALSAQWFKIPFDVLGKISNRITSEVKEVGRVAYDITSKPPATIEWE